MDAALALMKNITFVAVVVFKTVVVQSDAIVKLVKAASVEEEKIRNLTDQAIRKIYKSNVDYCNRVTKVIITYLYGSGTIYVLDGLYKSYTYYENHPNVKPEDPKPHTVLFWFPFDHNRYYKIAIAYESFHIFQTLNYNGVAQSVVSSVMVFLKIELKVLQHHIRAIQGGSRDYQKVLIKCAIKHQQIIQWVNDFNNNFRFIILFEYSMISLTLATILIDILQGTKICFNATFFALNFTQLFVLAWNANQISDESSISISDALYACSWYEFDKTTQDFVLFMTLRCKKPLNISNGPFGYINMDAALSRVKLAYTVVSVLSTSTK
uniref:Odorant receptor 43 n=1 Tax=Ips typographus TaxID=55986 RepID=M3V894_IPSTY